ncbi:MAG: cyclic nucleotide-binding domain-containing protein [Candidatus Kapabacteria bacterium]|nr:cyclic nucleotide-binding domain-containing protein [Candidatus Kapabacteria bacterium]
MIPLSIIYPDSWLQLFQLAKIITVSHFVIVLARKFARYATSIRLAHFAYILMIILHWIACAWLAIRPLTDNKTALSHYIWSFYYATTTLATVGYGDITPQTDPERIFAIVIMLIGMVMYAYLIGNIATLLNRIDPARVHYEENLDRVHAFIRYRSIPSTLVRRITDYYDYMWEKRLGYDESAILSTLPTALRKDIVLYLKRDVIERVTIFHDASEDFIHDIAAHLHPQIAMPGDYIFNIGDIGRSMYFISKGSVEILDSDGNQLIVRSAGEFFGELALLHKRKRSASVRALEYTDLYVLDVATFDRILADHPDFRTRLVDLTVGR